MKLAIITALVFVLFACGDDSKTQRVGIVTYNVGLATGFVDYAPQRRPIVGQVVADLDADLVCLQEVWTQGDVDAVLAATAATFPHSHYVMLQDTTLGPPACTATETGPLAACVDEKCPDTPASDIAGCALANCESEFGALSSDCVACVVANIGKEVEAIITTCQTASQKYAYDGANGLVLLSRYPLNELAHEALTSTNVQRSVLGARVELPVLGDTAVVCTHLAADLTSAGVSYNGPFGSWAGENTHHADAALAFAATYAGVKHRVIFGDMNSGPAFADSDVQAEIAGASYQTFLDAGFVDFPTAGKGDAQACTYCSDNTLVKSSSDVQIDRIVLSAVPSAAKALIDRIGIDVFTIRSGDVDVSTHPSDHYGVRLVIETP